MSMWEQAFQSRSDLAQYGSNALGLFALGLKFGLEDLDTVAADALTDGNDDKKCDIVYIDPDEGHAVLAQCYYSAKNRQSALSSKASDLNTAVSWLLQRPHEDLPQRLRPSATGLRQAIIDGSLQHLHVWYIHNLPESENVRQELLTVEHTIDAVLKSHFPGKKLRVSTLEVGTSILDEWYGDIQSPILVSEDFDIRIPDGFEVIGAKWKAYVTTVPGRFLYRAYRKHRTKLFSANVREYLGSRRSDANINNGIKQSAQEAPADFWVYNNGLTILVHSYEVLEDKRGMRLKISGLSIVNGAQTTGALGSLGRSPSEDVQVPVRFVVTSDKETIFDIIQFNNSQNKVTASDFRSRDRVQRRLRDEIAKIPHAEYQGGRRGGASDAIRRNPNLLPSYTVGQALAAAQGDPEVAYNQKSDIWAADKLYARYFNEDTSGGHIVFSYSLLRCIEARKTSLVAKSKASSGLTEPESKELEYFRQRGSTYMLSSAIAGCLETILSRRITKISRVSFGNLSPRDAQMTWEPVVEVCASFCPQLMDAFADGLKNKDRIKKTLGIFQSLVQATANPNAPTFKKFAEKVKQG
ncbi:MAG: AIPR family protein [Desulfovibrionales bacterium]|nr:AIPR family protein [Desulfovibrionales bacterium]